MCRPFLLTPANRNFKKAALLLGLSLSLGLGLVTNLVRFTLLSSPILAQESGLISGETYATNPKNRQNTVSATVPSQSGPTTPILVSPSNGSYITTNPPTFVWKASTDDLGVDHYELAIDGSTLLSSIPTTATSNSQYTLTYNSSTTEYSLLLTSQFTQGSHTWKIRAVDTSGLGTDSATWTFIIDTQAPSFVVTAIGDQTVSISAQDLSTVPSTPVQLGANQPLLTALGEASSSVQVTLTIPGDPSQNFTTTIASDGTWSLQLGTLPRDVAMELDFIITDPAGNISILSDVPFIIPSPVIFPFPDPSPTPSPSPTPGASPEGSPSPEPSPSPSPLITIAIPPPQEIIQEGVQELLERIVPQLQVLTNLVPESVRETITAVAENVAPVSAAVLTAVVPVTSAIAVATQFGGQISPDLILKILQALGLLPFGRPKGLVFNSENYEPIPFALLTITSQQEDQPLTETVVTNLDGVYSSVQLPLGIYKILSSHQEYHFPSAKRRPAYLSMYDFYKGEAFTIDAKSSDPVFLIPMDKIELAVGAFNKTRWRIALSRLARLTKSLTIPFFFISAIIASLFPSIWNVAVFGIYAILLVRRVIIWFKLPIITGTVVDTQGIPIANTVVRISLTDTQETVAIIRSDQNGVFRLFGPPSTYQLVATKAGYIDSGSNSLSLLEVDTRTSPQHVAFTMQGVAALTEADILGIK